MPKVSAQWRNSFHFFSANLCRGGLIRLMQEVIHFPSRPIEHSQIRISEKLGKIAEKANCLPLSLLFSFFSLSLCMCIIKVNFLHKSSTQITVPKKSNMKKSMWTNDWIIKLELTENMCNFRTPLPLQRQQHNECHLLIVAMRKREKSLGGY